MKRWNKWLHMLRGLQSVAIPRWYLSQGIIRKIELHAFSDASDVGHGAVLYKYAYCIRTKVKVMSHLSWEKVGLYQNLRSCEVYRGKS